MEDTKDNVKWSVSSSVRATFSEDGAVLLDIEKGICYSLNVVGMKVWQILESDGGTSAFKDIVDVLAPQFAIPREQLGEDIRTYLQELAKKRLIKTNGFARPAKELEK